MLLMAWQIVQVVLIAALVFGAVTLGLLALVTVGSVLLRMVRWELLGHAQRASLIRQALEATLKRYVINPDAVDGYSFAQRDDLKALIWTANEWLRLHGWPSAFNETRLATAYADFKVDRLRTRFLGGAAINPANAPLPAQ